MKYLSIIIPVYNLSNYITKTLDSVEGSFLSSDEVEVIIVNDGSTDNSKNVINNRLKRGYSLIDIENAGVSAARNKAIDVSCGKYITFLDGDDLLFPNSVELLLDYLKKGNNPDVIVMKSFTQSNENYPWKHSFIEGKEYDSYDVFEKGYVRGSVCGCAFSRCLVEHNNVRFVKGLKYGEDSIFFATTLLGNTRVVFKDISFYNVTVRESSASRDINKLDLPNYSIGLEWLIDLHSSIRNTKDKAIVDFRIYKLISSLSNNAAAQNLSYTKLKRIVRPKNIPWLMWNKFPGQQFKVLILNLSFFLFYGLIRVLKR